MEFVLGFQCNLSLVILRTQSKTPNAAFPVQESSIKAVLLLSEANSKTDKMSTIRKTMKKYLLF